MKETEMVEVLHVILETICVLISRIFFQILLNMSLWKFSKKFFFFFEKVKPIAVGIFYRPPNANAFLIYFQTISSKLITKLMKFIFSETLIST